MSRRTLGILLLLGGSLVLGALGGEVNYRLFLKSVPPMALSQVSSSAAHMFFIGYGLVLGVVVFGWSMLAAVLARFFGADEPGRASEEPRRRS